MGGRLDDLRMLGWVFAALSCACHPSPVPPSSPASPDAASAYGIRGPCDSPDPMEACRQSSSGTFFLRMETQHAPSEKGAAGALLALGPEVDAVEACYREAASRAPGLACRIQLTVGPAVDAGGARRFGLDATTSCPSALAACVLSAARPVDAKLAIVPGQEAPSLLLSLGPHHPDDPRTLSNR